MDADLIGPLVGILGERAEVRAAGADLLIRYAEPQRRYHTAEHLAEMSAALRRLTGASGAPAAPAVDPAIPPAVHLAVLWHDAIYDPTAGDNEERSARLAAETLPGLGASEELVGETVRLVRLTAAHRPEPGDVAGELLSDADLAVLASPPDRYARYVAAVRQEYAHVDADGWRAGRSAVLRGLLDGGIFRTTVGRTWTGAAQANVRAELADLGA